MGLVREKRRLGPKGHVELPESAIVSLRPTARIRAPRPADHDAVSRVHHTQNLPLGPDQGDPVIGCTWVMRNLPRSAGGRSSGRFRTSARAACDPLLARAASGRTARLFLASPRPEATLIAEPPARLTGIADSPLRDICHRPHPARMLSRRMHGPCWRRPSRHQASRHHASRYRASRRRSGRPRRR
jgi:hypothetical protein